MAKKKRAKKVGKRKATRAKTISKVDVRRATKRKINLVLKNFVIFVILFLVSLLLYSASSNPFFENFFWLLAFLFGFVSIAFLIILLVFFFMRLMKK